MGTTTRNSPMTSIFSSDSIWSLSKCGLVVKWHQGRTGTPSLLTGFYFACSFIFIFIFSIYIFFWWGGLSQIWYRTGRHGHSSCDGVESKSMVPSFGVISWAFVDICTLCMTLTSRYLVRCWIFLDVLFWKRRKKTFVWLVLAVIYLQTLVYSSGETETDSIFDRCFDARVVETIINRFFFFLFFPVVVNSRHHNHHIRLNRFSNSFSQVISQYPRMFSMNTMWFRNVKQCISHVVFINQI